MRYIAYLFLIVWASHVSQAQEYVHPSASDPGYLNESNRFMFFENYWLNMQHWLYNMSLYSQEEPISEVIGERYEEFTDSEKEVVASAVDYYQKNILEHDLRFGELTFAFKRWVITQTNDELQDIPSEMQEMALVLQSVRPVYDKYYWVDHHKQNLKVLSENIELIRALEDTSVLDLERLCYASWQAEKIRVDISYHSKYERPYTTITPVAHIVMDSKRNHAPAGNWFELLLHETSHHMIHNDVGFVGGTILDVADQGNYRLPRQLSHSYLFYLSGIVARRHLQATIPDYELYIVRRGIFKDRLELLRKYLDPYVAGEISLHDATVSLLEEYWKEE